MLAMHVPLVCVFITLNAFVDKTSTKTIEFYAESATFEHRLADTSRTFNAVLELLHEAAAVQTRSWRTHLESV